MRSNLLFVVAELIAGFFAGSLALLADAGHNASDVVGLLLAWGAAALGKTKPSPRWTYGLRRSSVLAALANAILLLIAVGAIGWEAIKRLLTPEQVGGGVVMIVAAIGIAVNTGTALLFLSGRKRDINIQGAFLHMAADAAVSLGVLIGGFLIRMTGWPWIDPAISLAIVVAITWSTWGLLRKSVALAMDAVPANIDPLAVRSFLAGLPGVAAVHDLHIWAMSTTETALTAHLVKPDLTDDDEFLNHISRQLHDRFGVEHVTIQIERRIERSRVPPGARARRVRSEGGRGSRRAGNRPKTSIDEKNPHPNLSRSTKRGSESHHPTK